MAAPLKSMWWMAAPLAAKNRVDLNNELDETWGRKKGFRVPSRAKESLTKFYHWAVQIDDMCYEVSHNDKCHGMGIFTDLCTPKPCPAAEWHERYVGVEPKTRMVGQTRKSHEEIMKIIDDIWTNFNNGRYDFLIQNCQNFVKMLCEQIVVSKDDPEVSKSEDWKTVPAPVSHRLADGSMAMLVSGTTYATYAAYLKALTAVIEAGQAGSLGAAGIAATNIEGAAVGAKGIAGGAGGVVKGGAAAGTGVSKAGLSAKVATLGLHGASATKAIAVGGGMLRVGATAVYFHPIAGAAVAGAGAGLVYLGTRGKKDKNWKSNSDADPENECLVVETEEIPDAEEVTVEDLMAMEAMVLEHAEIAEYSPAEPLVENATIMTEPETLSGEVVEEKNLIEEEITRQFTDQLDKVSSRASAGRGKKGPRSLIREWREKKGFR